MQISGIRDKVAFYHDGRNELPIHLLQPVLRLLAHMQIPAFFDEFTSSTAKIVPAEIVVGLQAGLQIPFRALGKRCFVLCTCHVCLPAGSMCASCAGVTGILTMNYANRRLPWRRSGRRMGCVPWPSSYLAPMRMRSIDSESGTLQE